VSFYEGHQKEWKKQKEEMAIAPATRVVSSGPFQMMLQHEALCVVSIPPDLVPKAAWWLVREYSLDQRDKGGSFSSLLLDDDGLSIVCSPLALTVLENLLQHNPAMIASKQRWKAFIITMVGSEFPGAVYYLADSLSKEGMSILHISTFESEVFLVQEQDVDRACSVLRRMEDPKRLEQMRNLADHQQARNESPYREGFELNVLPGNFYLTKLDDSAQLSSCASVLTRLLLFDPRYSALERSMSKAIKEKERSRNNSRSSLSDPADAPPPVPSSSSSKLAQPRDGSTGSGWDLTGLELGEEKALAVSDQRASSSSASFMWGLWQCDSELTLLLEEADVESFPAGSLVVSPQRWKVIKLCGRAIEFDETGIVSAMTTTQIQEGEGVSLNISTATTNCTLVPVELLSATLTSLKAALGCAAVDPTEEF
jgi:hypothetical protein